MWVHRMRVKDRNGHTFAVLLYKVKKRKLNGCYVRCSTCDDMLFAKLIEYIELPYVDGTMLSDRRQRLYINNLEV